MTFRSWASRALVSIALVAPIVVVPGPLGVSTVSAASAVTIEQTMAGQTLIGGTTSVTAHIGNSGDDTAFNLMLVLRLPVGVHLASSEIPPSTTIVETDEFGEPLGTVISFENIVDIIPNGSYNFSYSLSHDVGQDDGEWWVEPPNNRIETSMEAYASDAEGTVPRIVAVTDDLATTTEIVDASLVSDVANASTLLVPLLLTKSEPSPESELLRGVHDHQTVYTLTAQTGSAAGVGVGSVHDYLPAGLEFLGCGRDDHSTTEEYPGSGPLNPGNAPPLPLGSCRTPSRVETVTDPDGLPGGVYTHVQWDIAQTLPINTTVSMSYVAAIPMYENEAWPDGAAPDPLSLEQGSNLDNNTGPLTTQGLDGVTDGFVYTNYVSVGTTFEGGDEIDVTAETSVQAVDLAVHKYVDRQEINSGEISTWTLQFLTSEYVVEGGITGMAVLDVTPDGTCPFGSVNPHCGPTPGPDPAYTSTTFEETGPGTTELRWEQSEELDLTSLGQNEEFYVTFSTLALDTYSNGTQIVTNDEWTNQVDMEANVQTFEVEGPDGTHQPGRDVTDDSSASQAGSGVQVLKEVARPPAGEECRNGEGLDWKQEAVEATGPGDRVCFRITATPPDFLDTIEATLSDFLPVGFEYEENSARPGPANQVPLAIVEGPFVFGNPDTGQRIDWRLEPSSFIEPAQVAQAVFGALLVGGTTSMPDIGDSGDAFTNTARYSYQNSSGEIFVDADGADVEYIEAKLDLTKRITAVTNQTVPAPGVDTALDVRGGDTVTYEIVVTNSGAADATDAVVRDTLAINNDNLADHDAVCATQITEVDTTSTTGSGACDGDDLLWTGLTVPANSSITLSYDWTVLDEESAATSWTNEAGVVEYHTTTNTGTDFEYVPRDNISRPEEDWNTDPADDEAHVFSPGISLIKTRTTEVTETGNAFEDEATIGEVIHYRIEYRQSANTSVTDPTFVDDLNDTGLDLVESSVVLTAFDTPPGAACDSGTPIMDPPIPTVGTDVITIENVGVVSAPEFLDRCAVLIFDAIVRDAGGPVRPGKVTNTATVTFTVDTPDDRQATASVDTKVVEPNLTIDKRSGATGAILPGARVPYQLVVTNVSATQVSIAHDLVVVDTLPAEVVNVVDIVPAGAAYTPGGSTITWTLDPSFDLDPGKSLTLSYTAIMDSELVASATIENTGEVTGTSLLGVVTGERSAESTCSPLGCPGYFAEDSVTLTVAGPTITKSVVNPNQTFGHTVDYELLVVFPANLVYAESWVTDNLAAGDLKFLETLSAVCTGCVDSDRANFAYPPDELSTTPPTWDLGYLDAIPTTRRGIIRYRAVVVDDPSLVQDDLIVNTATLAWNDGANTVPSSATIRLAEPNLDLVKRVSSSSDTTPRDDTTNGDAIRALPGDTLSYELQITNSGKWTAYDTVVVDEPDSNVPGDPCDGPSRLTDPTVATDPLWTVTDSDLEGGSAGDACLGWLIPAILPNQTITLRYTVVVPEDFPHEELIVGSEFHNVAEITEYWALTAAERTVSPDDVRDYPATPETDDGFVNINGGILGDLVWFDIDGSGGPGPDPGEPGIPGVGIIVTWFGPNQAPGGGDDVVYDSDDYPSLTTDEDGIWSSTDNALPPTWLPTGQYSVAVDTATLPPGLTTNTYTPSDATNFLLAENEDQDDRDFGFTGDQLVGDFVWLDLDADGDQDPSEPGISGVPLEIVWEGFDGDIDTGDDILLDTVTTDANGGYLAPRVPAGDVRVTVNTTDLTAAGLDATFDLDGDLDGTAVRTVTAGADALDVDFGYAGTASLGDRVWHDVNTDGVQDADEPGIVGATVSIVWDGLPGGSAVTLPAVTTGANGAYSVPNLPAGDYTVTADPSSVLRGAAPTYDLDDGTVAPDGTTERTLTIGEDAIDVDFGFAGTGSLGDRVWYDVNGDGVQDPGEPGIPGVEVTASSGGITYPTVTTGVNGIYGVPDLPDGTYTIVVDRSTLPVSLSPSYDLDGIVTPDQAERLVSASDPNPDDVDFGYTGVGSIGDTLWYDIDGDGEQDDDEPGIAFVDVIIEWQGFDTTTDLDNETFIVETDENGVYGLDDLPGGWYVVTVDITDVDFPDGVEPTHDFDGIDTPHVAERELTDDDLNPRDVDFGYTGSASVGDTVWLDRNEDGDQDPLEPGIPGVTVTATWGGPDGVIGTGGDDLLWGTTTTDGDGRYGFGNLPPGEVQIVVWQQPLLDAGLVQTFDPDPDLDGTTVRTLAVGQNDPNADFGYNGANTIGDRVWYDVNANGVDDPGEPGIPDQAVLVVWAGPDDNLATPADNLVFLPVDTDDDGLWLVDGLPNGLVSVTLVGAPATNLRVTFDRDGGLDLTTAFEIDDDDLDFDFGLTGTAVIGDRVWIDFNADGVQDPLEPGLNDADITVRWAGWDNTFQLLPGPGNDDVVYPVQTTSLTGLYEIANLPPGRYRVTVDSTTLPDGVIPTFDLDGVASPHVAERTLAVGEIGRNVDFGYAGTAQIGDFVWWDLDGDSIQDIAEPGIPGVTVTAVWSGVDGSLGTVDDKIVPPVVTGPDGIYAFTNLPAGSYRVTVLVSTLPPGMSATFDLDGGGDSTAVRAVTTGTIANNVDFGYVGTLTIGDLVWDDVDLDGIRSTGEPAIGGARVTLRFLGRDGVPGGGDDVVVTAITADPPQLAPSGPTIAAASPNPGDPYYLVPGLVPGNYIATLDVSSLPAGLTPVSDLDGGDPVTTAVTLAASNNLDVDFVVFHNVSPLPPLPGDNVARVACGSDVVVSPTAGVTDENEDDLSLVPGSIVAPAGVTVLVLADGNLRIMTSRDVADGAQVQWAVQDEHGASTTVTLTLAVNCINATASGTCSTTGAQTMTYAVTGVGAPASPPVTITWYAADGTRVLVSTGQPLAGTVPWPAQVPLLGVSVEFETVDGATSQRIDVIGSCQPLPGTGGDTRTLSMWALLVSAIGLTFVVVTRRRRA